jgi:hypothetical protein
MSCHQQPQQPTNHLQLRIRLFWPTLTKVVDLQGSHSILVRPLPPESWSLLPFDGDAFPKHDPPYEWHTRACRVVQQQCFLLKAWLQCTSLCSHQARGLECSSYSLNVSGLLQIHALVVFSFALGHHKVSLTEIMAKRPSKRFWDDYL